MQTSEIVGEKRSNPFMWTTPSNKFFDFHCKAINRKYWEWEIKYNNLKVL